MPTAVVLGSHRSGTSLVASLLQAMGVDMGAQMMGGHVSQPFGHHEDLDFVRMNNEILAGAGGTWSSPAGIDWQKFRPELVMLVTMKQRPELREGGEARKDGAWWGWKDPRTCLTAPCYHGYLEQPHYIVVDRHRDSIVKSLEWREGKAGDRWAELTDYYLEQREWFLDNVDGPRLHVQYEDVVDAERGPGLALQLANFLGMGQGAADAALAKVRPRSNPYVAPSEYIVHLGDVVGKWHYADHIRVVNANKWERGWSQVHGPVHGLVIGDGADPDEAKGWLAKVRPGGLVCVEGDFDARPDGLVYVEGDFKHDWPETTWAGSLPTIHRRKPFLKRGDPFGTIGIGVPYYKPEYDFWRWWSWMLLEGLEPGDVFLNDESVMAPLPIPVVHNRLIAKFLETDRDTLVIVEDDHVADPEILRRMRDKQENWDFDIVCANYVNRRMMPALTGYGLGGKTAAGEVICVLNWDEAKREGTDAVDGAAMGLVLIRRWVLDAMLAGGNPKECFWCEWHGGNSQDITFYWKAREVGAKAAVDRDANLGHIARTVRTVDDFWEHRSGTKAPR